MAFLAGRSSIVVAVFALGLFPDEPMRKTELAARQYQKLVASERTGPPMASRSIATPPAPLDALPVVSAATKIESAR